MAKLLKWIDKGDIKIAEGKDLYFAYQKVGKVWLLVIECGSIGVRHFCKTEKDCLIISNILNKV